VASRAAESPAEEQVLVRLAADPRGGTLAPAPLSRDAVEPASAAELIDGLAAAGIVRTGWPVEFVHPLVRSAVEGDMPAGERSRLHARAAELLAAAGVPEERVAGHLLATYPAGDQHTVEVLARTAQAALAHGAPASAVSYLERALAEPPDAAARPVVLRHLGVAEMRAGRAEAAARHLEEARRAAADPSQRAQAARGLVGPLMALGRRGEAVVALEDALAESLALEPDLLLAVKAELLLIGTLEPASYPDVAERLAPLDAGVEGSSPGVREYLAALTAHAGLGLRPAAEVRRLAARAHAAGIVEELSSGVIGWANVLYPPIVAEDFALADRMVEEAFADLRRRASVVGTARAHAARSFLQLRRGNVREAVADARTAVDAGRAGGFQGWPIALSTLVEALVEHGDGDAAEAALEETGVAHDVPDTFMSNWVLLARARLRVLQGRVDEAIADLEELGRRNDERGHANPALLPQRSDLAAALLRRGARDRALALAGEELALSRRWGTPRTIGVSLRVLGLAEGGERGRALLRESADTLAGSDARLEHARSLVELGAALRRSGARAAAREPLHAGMELAHECGAPPLVERARQELVATGARPRRIMRAGVDALTPSELQVARQAAAGMTNREIAQALFVTQRTVETHLTQVFRKLGVSSRDAVARALG
jgi:DNA-binding CsgD family transcriptional regulator/tetratricopeptide (TPR) repeat protein